METRVGPYSIIRLIGGGGQGQVYLGYDPRLRRLVAIKIHRLPGTRRGRRTALQEARKLARLQDDRVVRVHDVVESPDYLALVMEYIPGCDLERVLSGTTLSLASVLVVAMDLAAGLAAARQQGIVHGDLKASNVLITDRGRAMLTDFGIAAAAHAGAAGPGSASAAAPEQVAGDPLDVRTDLFALGRLLYRMLTGEHSFAIAGKPSLQALAGGGPPDLRARIPRDREVPEALCALVDRLLQKSPGDRPANTHPVRRELREVARSQPLSVAGSLLREARPFFRPDVSADRPPDIPRQLGRSGRSRNALVASRRRWLALLPRSRAGRLGLAAVIVVGAVGLALQLQPEPLAVHIRDPVLRVDPGAGLAQGVDATFLVAQADAGLRERRAEVHLSGAVAPRKVFTGTGPLGAPAVGEQLAIEVRCGGALCLVDLRRQGSGVQASHRQILPSDAPVQAWRDSLQRALAGLYP